MGAAVTGMGEEVAAATAVGMVVTGAAMEMAEEVATAARILATAMVAVIMVDV